MPLSMLAAGGADGCALAGAPPAEAAASAAAGECFDERARDRSDACAAGVGAAGVGAAGVGAAGVGGAERRARALGGARRGEASAYAVVGVLALVRCARRASALARVQAAL